MDFITFLFVNAVLFLRPQEVIPEFQRLQLYYFSMLACLAFSFMALVKFFFQSPLIKHPTVIFVYGTFFLACASLLVNNEFGEAIDEMIEFTKIIIYFTLFLAVIRTPDRLQGVFSCVIVCVTITALIAIAHFYEIITVPSLVIQEELVENRATWTNDILRRLRFTGVLNDPNEVAVFLCLLGFLSAFKLTRSGVGLSRFLWAGPIGVFLFCIFLTRSRGGLLAMLFGLAVFALYRFRSKKALVFLALTVPIILIAFAGRQTDISANANTAQTRFGLWSDWLQEFRANMIIGVGPLVAANEEKAASPATSPSSKHLAHNTYLQAYADLGFLGGLFFLGAVGFGLITVHRYGFGKTVIYDPELARLQPYLMAGLASGALGFLVLTLNYVLPTFFVLALPVAYYGMTPCHPPIERPRLSMESILRLGVAGVGFLAFTYAMVLVMPKQ